MLFCLPTLLVSCLIKCSCTHYLALMRNTPKMRTSRKMLLDCRRHQRWPSKVRDINSKKRYPKDRFFKDRDIKDTSQRQRCQRWTGCFPDVTKKIMMTTKKISWVTTTRKTNQVTKTRKTNQVNLWNILPAWYFPDFEFWLKKLWNSVFSSKSLFKKFVQKLGVESFSQRVPGRESEVKVSEDKVVLFWPSLASKPWLWLGLRWLWLSQTLSQGHLVHSNIVLRTSFFSDTCWPCFFLSLFIYDRTDVYHKANMPFTYAYLTFTL